MFNSAKPGFPQFPPREATRALPKPSLFDEIIRVSSDRLPANPGHKDAANPVVIAPVSRHVIPAADAILRQTAGQAPVGSPVSTGPEGAPNFARRAGAEPEIASDAAAPIGPAVHRLTQTMRLKLDSVQAGCVGAGILLCLSFQVAIIVVLLKQRSLQPMQSAPLLPVFERSMPLRDRSTAIADLAVDSSLWDGAGSSIGRKWQQEEDNLRKQEATIVEEIISRNVILARELAQS